jgi:YebC/PmpR family DNA-binding regulatory protein
MSGHSKWSSIKHKKGVADARRGQLFSKLSRAIIVAAREGGPDPSANLALQNAIDKARSYSVPKDNIERAIARGSGADADEQAFETVVYEGYGPGGVAVLVEALTDNRNRTAGEIRVAFTKFGGNLGETNSVSFMFDRKGIIRYPAKAASGDAMFEAALDAGADDVSSDADAHEVLCAVEQFAAVRDALEAKFGAPQEARAGWRPQNTVPVDGPAAESLLKLLDALEDNDDVQNVVANFEVADDVLQRMTA